MQEEQYQLVFCGSTLDGFDLIDVKGAFARFFKVEPSQVDEYFTGVSRVVSKGLDEGTANHYAEVLKNAGIAVLVELMGKESQALPKDQRSPIGKQDKKISLIVSFVKRYHHRVAWCVLVILLAIRLALWCINYYGEPLIFNHYKTSALALCSGNKGCSQLVNEQFKACFNHASKSIAGLNRGSLSERLMEKALFGCFVTDAGEALMRVEE